MRIVYFGTGTFALPAMERFQRHIVCVVAQPDRPSGRGMRLQPSPVKSRALELGLRVETPEKARAAEFVDFVKSLEPDFLLVASYGQILSQALLDAGKRGGINLHGSLLPLHRGAAPIQRAILEGQTETGITLMQMDKGMDTGDEIARVATPIGADETYGELQDRLAILATDLAQEWLERISSGDYPRIPQDSGRATLAPKIAKEEAELSFGIDALTEYARFRAFTPAPGAFLRTRFGLLKLAKARYLNGTGATGTLLPGGEGCPVAFQSGAIDLLEVQPEGKKRMSGRDFMNGNRLKAGSSLE